MRRIDRKLYRVFRDRRVYSTVGYPGEESPELESDIDHAISNFTFCWSGAHSDESRFSDGTWPVLYTAEDCQTSVTEVVFHLDKTFGNGFDDGEEMNFKLVQYCVGVDGDVACFATAPVEEKKALTSSDYKATIPIAKRVRDGSFPAMRTPSARRVSGLCVPIFSEAVTVMKSDAVKIGVSIAKGSRAFVSRREGVTLDLAIEDVHSTL